jgi:hypothetical protein
MKSKILFLTICLAALSFNANARFRMPELEQVPTDRLITNLTQKAKESPKDVQIIYALARVHAMASAKAASIFDVTKTDGVPYFGPRDQGFLPRENAAGTNDAARSHLNSAIKYYSQALEISSDHLPSEVGLGWCLDQAGKKKEAAATYRKALDKAWADEKNSGRIFQMSVAAEICDYLMPLLDAQADAAEIKRINQIKEEVARMPRAMTPLLVPLESGLSLEQMVDTEAAVPFDLDGSGILRNWQWPTPKAGWLAYDPAATGEVRSGIQLFGEVTFWIFWENGYQALASLDDNGDGILTGPELNGLVLWCDANSNGTSDPGEVLPLSCYGVTALSCRYQTHSTGIAYSPEGVVFKDGQTRPTFDWISRAK